MEIPKGKNWNFFYWATTEEIPDLSPPNSDVPSSANTRQSFIGFRMRNTPDIMHKTSVSFKALMALFFIGFFCIPVSAYSSDATNLFNAGRELTESGNYTEAMAAFHDAIALEPLYYEAWDSLADALNRNGQFNDALAASNRSLELHPDYVQGWINRGQILYNIGYWYEDVVHNSTAADALYAEQLTAFEKAVTLDPNSAEAWFNKGYALAGMKQYDEAIAAFDQVNVIDPSYPNLQKNREIAVLLRDKTAVPAITTVSASQSTPSTAPSPEPSGQQPAGTPPQPSPLYGITGAIAILGAGFLLMQRK